MQYRLALRNVEWTVYGAAPPYLTWPEFRFSMRATEDWAGVTATRLERRRTEICTVRAIGNLADVVVAVAPLEDISTPPRSNGSEGRKSQTREEAVRSNRSRVWNLMDDPTSTEMRFILCTWLGELSSCSCLTVLPGPAWVMLKKFCKE